MKVIGQWRHWLFLKLCFIFGSSFLLVDTSSHHLFLQDQSLKENVEQPEGSNRCLTKVKHQELGSEALSKILDAPQYKIPRRIPNAGSEIATRACITSNEFRAFEEQKQYDNAEKKWLVEVKKEAREASKRTKALASAQKKRKTMKVQKKTSKPIPNQATLDGQKKTRKTFVSPLVKQE